MKSGHEYWGGRGGGGVVLEGTRTDLRRHMVNQGQVHRGNSLAAVSILVSVVVRVEHL